MKLIVFAIQDRQVGSFMTPYFMQSEGQAIRSFADEVNRAAEDNILYRHPDDFSLFCLGEFESTVAEFVMEKIPRLIVTGSSVKVPAGGDPRQLSLVKG